jgi:hypothetical protein
VGRVGNIAEFEMKEVVSLASSQLNRADSNAAAGTVVKPI